MSVSEKEAELDCRFEALKQSPPARMLREKIIMVPLAAAIGSLALLALARRIQTPKRPFLFRAGIQQSTMQTMHSTICYAPIGHLQAQC
jgi:hypothetical protein